MVTFIKARTLLKNSSTGKTIKKGAEEILEEMVKVSHPFSAFWRWQFLNDSFLRKNYPHLKNGF